MKWGSAIRSDIEVVEWRSFNRDERGVALIGSEFIGKEYTELCADGTIYFKDPYGSIKKKEKVGLDILKGAVQKYKNKQISIIKISDLLKEAKKEAKNSEIVSEVFLDE